MSRVQSIRFEVLCESPDPPLIYLTPIYELFKLQKGTILRDEPALWSHITDNLSKNQL